ncbi:MAG: mechanosensitive ion channel domain-containing protein [Caldilineaceae bacterium]
MAGLTELWHSIAGDLKVMPLVTIFLLLVGGWVVTTLLQRYLPRLANRLPNRTRSRLLSAIPGISVVLNVLVLLTGLVILLSSYETSSIVSLVGAVGLGIGFALNPLATGIVAGIVAIYEQAYRTGDWVEVDGDYGVVTSIGLRSFKMMTPDDTEVTIPHNRIWTENIANANAGSPDHLVVTDFYLSPTHDARQVRQKLWDVGVTSPYTQLSKSVTVVLSEKPWGTHYRLKAYPIDGRDEFQFVSDLTVRGKAALAQMGVEPANARAVAV